MPFRSSDLMKRNHRLLVYKWAGHGYSERDICSMLGKKLGGQVRIPTIKKILNTPEAHGFVAKHRMDFLTSVKDIPIADKKVRLDDLEMIRQRLVNLIKNVEMHKSDIAKQRFLKYTNVILKVMEMARGEVEQKPGLAFGFSFGEEPENEDISDENLRTQRDELLRLAGVSVERGFASTSDITEPDEEEDPGESPEVFLAPPEELQRDELRPGVSDVQDLRQPDSDGKGMPTS